MKCAPQFTCCLLTVCRLCFWLSFLVGIAALILIWLLYPKDFDYSSAVTDNVTYFQVWHSSLTLQSYLSQHLPQSFAPCGSSMPFC